MVSPGTALVSGEGLSRLSLVWKTPYSRNTVQRIHHPGAGTLAGRLGMDISPLCVSLL